MALEIQTVNSEAFRMSESCLASSGFFLAGIPAGMAEFGGQAGRQASLQHQIPGFLDWYGPTYAVPQYP